MLKRPSQYVMTVLVLVVIALTGDNRVGGYKQLVDSHATTTASATSTACWNHNEVKYEFEVKGRKYSGNTYWLDTPCDGIKPGYQFSVNYDPLNPTLNATMAPDEAYSFHLDHLLVRIAAGVFVIVGFLFAPSRRKRRFI